MRDEMRGEGDKRFELFCKKNMWCDILKSWSVENAEDNTEGSKTGG